MPQNRYRKSHKKPILIAMDFESILVPEIWISIAKKTRIPELRLTTRDVPDYDQLMKKRLKILAKNNLSLKNIQSIIAEMEPIAGAKEFLDWARMNFETIIVSDTFYEFARPLIQKLNHPTLLCHLLETNNKNQIIDYHLRESGKKENAVKAFKNLGFRVIAIDDSYNDTDMLKTADIGILFNASSNVVSQFPQFSSCYSYDKLKTFIQKV